MGVSVGVSVDLRRLEQDLSGSGERAKDIRPWLRGHVSPDVTTLLVQQFASQGSRMRRGHRWARLSASTLRSKARRGTIDNGILIDSGAMWRAFVETSDSDSVEVFNRQRYIRSVQGDAKRIAGYHRDGTPRMPARPVMGDGIPLPVQSEWGRSLAHYVLTGIVDPGGDPPR